MHQVFWGMTCPCFFCTCLDSVCEMLLQFFYIAFECAPIKFVICFVCMALRGVTMQCFQDVVLWTWGPHVAELVRYGSMLFVFGICSPRRPPPVALVICNALTYFDFDMPSSRVRYPRMARLPDILSSKIAWLLHARLLMNAVRCHLPKSWWGDAGSYSEFWASEATTGH